MTSSSGRGLQRTRLPAMLDAMGSPTPAVSVHDLRVPLRRYLTSLPEAITRDRARSLPADVLNGARELGLFGLAIPTMHGGLGMGLGDIAELIAELARVDRSLATTVGLHNGLGTRALIENASDALALRHFPKLASGETIAAFAATEPNAGSDLSAVQTHLSFPGGRGRLTGQKAYVTNAGLAGLFTVLARAADAAGGSASVLVLVEREAEGLSLGGEEHKMGLAASSTCALYLDDVEVPAEHLLGGLGDGVKGAHRALEWGRTLMSAGCLGTARSALERSLAHAQHRKQFRRTLHSFGAVRAHLASMASTIFILEAVLRAVTEGEARGSAISTTSSALKVLASELGFDACDRAVQVHGALGFVEDSGVALLQRDARVTRIFEGANDVLLLHLGSALLAGRGLSADLPEFSELAPVRARFDARVQMFRRSLGVRAVGHQRLVLALAQADVALFAAAQCLRHASDRSEPLARAAVQRMVGAAERAIADSGCASTDELLDLLVLESLGTEATWLVRPN